MILLTLTFRISFIKTQSRILQNNGIFFISEYVWQCVYNIKDNLFIEKKSLQVFETIFQKFAVTSKILRKKSWKITHLWINYTMKNILLQILLLLSYQTSNFYIFENWFIQMNIFVKLRWERHKTPSLYDCIFLLPFYAYFIDRCAI